MGGEALDLREEYAQIHQRDIGADLPLVPASRGLAGVGPITAARRFRAGALEHCRNRYKRLQLRREIARSNWNNTRIHSGDGRPARAASLRLNQT